MAMPRTAASLVAEARLLDAIGASSLPQTIAQLMPVAGIDNRSQANHLVDCLLGRGAIVRIGEPGEYAYGLPFTVPALPTVRAALPTDRSLRPHVGVVVLLDRQAA